MEQPRRWSIACTCAHVFGVYLDTKQATRGRTISEECASTESIVKYINAFKIDSGLFAQAEGQQDFRHTQVGGVIQDALPASVARQKNIGLLHELLLVFLVHLKWETSNRIYLFCLLIPRSSQLIFGHNFFQT